MTYATHNAAVASLREFSTALRAAHRIVRFYSEKHCAYRYGRVLNAAKARMF